MKRSIPFLFVLLFVASIALTAASGTPKMVIEQVTHDAGEVYRTGTPIEHAFVVKNTGTSDLTILEVKPG